MKTATQIRWTLRQLVNRCFFNGKQAYVTGRPAPRFEDSTPIRPLHAKTLAAANDNCFWKWLLGPTSHFDFAASVRRRLERVKNDAKEFVTSYDLFVIEQNQLALDLFCSLYVERDVEQAKALAPKLNKYLPDLMMYCPDKSLRPPTDSN